MALSPKRPCRIVPSSSPFDLLPDVLLDKVITLLREWLMFTTALSEAEWAPVPKKLWTSWYGTSSIMQCNRRMLALVKQANWKLYPNAIIRIDMNYINYASESFLESLPETKDPIVLSGLPYCHSLEMMVRPQTKSCTQVYCESLFKRTNIAQRIRRLVIKGDTSQGIVEDIVKLAIKYVIGLDVRIDLCRMNESCRGFLLARLSRLASRNSFTLNGMEPLPKAGMKCVNCPTMVYGFGAIPCTSSVCNVPRNMCCHCIHHISSYQPTLLRHQCCLSL